MQGTSGSLNPSGQTAVCFGDLNRCVWHTQYCFLMAASAAVAGAVDMQAEQQHVHQLQCRCCGTADAVDMLYIAG